MAKKINLVITPERVREQITVEEFVDIQENKFPTIVRVLAKFIVDEQGQYIEYHKALGMIGAISIGDLEEVAKDFGGKVGDAIGTNPKPDK